MAMMYEPLLTTSIIRQAAINYPRQKVVSRCRETGIVEHSYSDIYTRCQRLAHVLTGLGAGQGDHIATLVGLEYTSSPGGLLRYRRHRCGGAYSQPASARRADRLHP